MHTNKSEVADVNKEEPLLMTANNRIPSQNQQEMCFSYRVWTKENYTKLMSPN